MLRNLFIGLTGVAILAAPALAQEKRTYGPDSEEHKDVPRGEVSQMKFKSEVFAKTERDIWIYVPAQYDGKEPACVMVFQDGGSYVNKKGQFKTTIVFDNLIHKKKMPVTIGIFINPGVFPDKTTVNKKGEKVPESNRSFEYDTLSPQYATMLDKEILPLVGEKYKLRQDAAGRAICGISSGGICAFTVAWERPDLFSKVLSHVGSFTNIRGGDKYPGIIRKTKNKDIRVFLQDGTHDLDNEHGNWWLANLQMEAAFQYKKYDHKTAWSDGGHNGLHGGSILPESLVWLWRGEVKGQAEKGSTEALENLIKNWENALIFGTIPEQKKALEDVLPTKKDLMTLFPEHADKLWPLVLKGKAELFARIDAKEKPGEAAGGKVLSVKVEDVRKEKRFQEVVKLLPAGTPVYDFRSKTEKGGGGGGSFVLVNGRWIWFQGIEFMPEVLKKLAE